MRRWGDETGHPVRVAAVDAPEDLSPPVADLLASWYAELGRPTDRLLVESFILHAPVAAMRTASVPFWTLFAVEPSVRRLADYLDRAPPYDEILGLLFPHGVKSVGLAGPEQWRPQLRRAERRGALLAVDEARFPADFAVFTRYGPALCGLQPRYPLPAEPLPIASVQQLFAVASG